MLAAIAGGALGPWATGALYDAHGSYAEAFWICVGLSGLSVDRRCGGRRRARCAPWPAGCIACSRPHPEIRWHLRD